MHAGVDHSMHAGTRLRLVRERVQRRAAQRGGKPLLRGWFHGFAALGAVVATIALLGTTAGDPQRLIAALVFGLSMVTLYTASSVYHLGTWQGHRSTLLRTVDHASSFVLIAGTYTPICMIILTGWRGRVVLAVIWALAAMGMGCALLTLRLPRWATAAPYLGMGWLALIPLPRLVQILPTPATAVFATGGLLYTMGAVIYTLRRPTPGRASSAFTRSSTCL